MEYSEEYIIENADTFKWENFSCEQSNYSAEFLERFSPLIKTWLLNNKRHRESGPAVITHHGVKMWYKDGSLHNENGPSVVYVDNSVEYFLEGINLLDKEMYEQALTLYQENNEWRKLKFLIRDHA